MRGSQTPPDTAEEYKCLQSDVKTIKLEIGRLSKKLSAMLFRMRELEPVSDWKKPITVTKHALLRYLERVWNVDVEQAEKEVVPFWLVDLIEEKPTGIFKAQTHRLVVENKNVITVLP